ncbi:unnamed protein product [Rotaria sp. Silwood2]|nr:unnamed protein product [Rotaria sp. Silwood2]
MGQKKSRHLTTPQLEEAVIRRITRATSFLPDEIQYFYYDFLKYTPTGYLTLGDFEKFYQTLFRNGDSEKFAQYAFNAYDTNHDDIVDFEEFIKGLYYTTKASANEKIRWAFDLCDQDVLFGLITVTFINCSALCGAIILPFRHKPIFKWILSSFIGLAVGTLTGSGIFHLIPMAFNIPDLDIHHSYLNKALITMVIIYIYYMRDQLLRIFLNVETIVCIHTHGENNVLTKPNCHVNSSSMLDNSKGVSLNSAKERRSNGIIQNLKKMKAAGWMIFIGDMLHNFIDGLTLGAAFMVSIGEGLQVSLPIIFEEFPHELGDIAVLLSSGLTIGQALIMNFLSACSCYLGFIIGAKLGELEQFHPWIYALAGGMFVYIGLADMIPELVAMGDEIEKDYIEAKRPITTVFKLKILFCQNSGLILGFIIMFLLGKYGEHLENLVKL